MCFTASQVLGFHGSTCAHHHHRHHHPLHQHAPARFIPHLPKTNLEGSDCGSVVCLQSKQWLQRRPGPGLSGRVCLIDPPLPLCLDVLTGGSPLHILLRLRPIIPTISCCKSERPCFTSLLEGQTSSRRCFFFPGNQTLQ